MTLDFLGQVDSSIYQRYVKDPDVTKIKYTQEFYSNKKVKEEGWVVSYKNAATSKIFIVTNADPNVEYHIKVGIWYGYYKGGQRQYIDSSYNTDSVAGNIRTEYDKEGRMTEKHYNSNQKEIDDKHTKVLFGPLHDKSSDKSVGDRTTSFYYYKNGQVSSIRNYCNNKPCGTDKYFDENGKLTKEVKHN